MCIQWKYVYLSYDSDLHYFNFKLESNWKSRHWLNLLNWRLLFRKSIFLQKIIVYLHIVGEKKHFSICKLLLNRYYIIFHWLFFQILPKYRKRSFMWQVTKHNWLATKITFNAHRQKMQVSVILLWVLLSEK